MNYEVQFIDVGRGKKCWNQTFQQEPTEPIIERAVKKSGALMSRDIEAVFDCADAGFIAAGFRPVGRFRVISAATSRATP